MAIDKPIKDPAEIRALGDEGGASAVDEVSTTVEQPVPIVAPAVVSASVYDQETGATRL